MRITVNIPSNEAITADLAHKLERLSMLEARVRRRQQVNYSNHADDRREYSRRKYWTKKIREQRPELTDAELTVLVDAEVAKPRKYHKKSAASQ